MDNKIDFKILKEQTGLNGEDFLELLLDSLPVEVFVKDTNGIYIFANKKHCENDGLTKSEVIGKKDEELFDEKVYMIYSQTDKEAITFDKEIYYTTDSTLTKNLRTYKAPFKKSDGSLIGIAGYSYDSTVILNKIRSLEIDLGRYEGVFNNAPLGIAIYNSIEGNAIEINEKYSEITGRKLEELVTLPWQAYSHHSEIEENQQYLKLMAERKINGFNMEKRYIKPDGSTVWVHMIVNRYKDEINSEAHVVVIIDITSRKEAEEKARYYYNHDTMTGLYNRKYGEEKLIELDKEENLPLSMLVADANGLKVTNDAFGHKEGDRIIKKLASVFLDSVGPDDCVIRTGGDEFLVILPNSDGLTVSKLIEKINRRFEDDIEDGFLLSMAMGCSTKEFSDENIDNIHQIAESRMYQNKIQNSDLHKIKIIEHLQNKLEKQDPFIKDHCLNVKKYALELGERLGLDEDAKKELAIAAYYHDIGKVGLDLQLVNRTEDLDQRDWVKFMKHSEIGYQILKSVAEYGRIADYVLYHHGGVSGAEYPTSSKGREIPLQAKILSIAEAYSDMIMDKSYRKKLTKETAILELRKGAGKRFDAKLVDIFIEEVLSEDEAL